MTNFDLDGDGDDDGRMLDRFGDQVADTIGYDTDDNGIIDVMAVDTNNDSIIDTYAYDPNQDGLLDVVIVDYDENGTADAVIRDSNNNGLDDAQEPNIIMGVIGGTPTRDGPMATVIVIAREFGTTVWTSPTDVDGDGVLDVNDRAPRDPNVS